MRDSLKVRLLLVFALLLCSLQLAAAQAPTGAIAQVVARAEVAAALYAASATQAAAQRVSDACHTTQASALDSEPLQGCGSPYPGWITS